MNKPKLILGPWRAKNDYQEAYMRLIIGNHLGFFVYLYTGGMDHYAGLWYHNRDKKFFSSKQQAMDDLDDNLRKEFDVVFLTQEQFDKLQVLV